MSDKERIEEGDTVRVVLCSEPALIGTVKYTPVATGDAWRIVTSEGKVIYVQTYETIMLISKRPDNLPF